MRGNREGGGWKEGEERRGREKGERGEEKEEDVVYQSWYPKKSLEREEICLGLKYGQCLSASTVCTS